MATSTAGQPRHLLNQCVFIQCVLSMHVCVNACVCEVGTARHAGRVALVRARSGDLIGAAAAGVFPEFQ